MLSHSIRNHQEKRNSEDAKSLNGCLNLVLSMLSLSFSRLFCARVPSRKIKETINCVRVSETCTDFHESTVFHSKLKATFDIIFQKELMQLTGYSK